LFAIRDCGLTLNLILRPNIAREAFSNTVSQGDGRPSTSGADRSSAVARSLRTAAAQYWMSSGMSDSLKCAGADDPTKATKTSASGCGRSGGGRSRTVRLSSGTTLNDAADFLGIFRPLVFNDFGLV
jgi:hypothetical protein